MKKYLLLIILFLGIATTFYLIWAVSSKQVINVTKDTKSPVFCSADVGASMPNGFLSKHIPVGNDQQEIETILNQPQVLDSSLQAWDAFEKTDFLQRGTLEWLQFTGQLYDLTGDPKFIDELEFIFYNHLLGEVNISSTPNKKTTQALAHIPHYISGNIQNTLVINFYESGSYTTRLAIQGKRSKVKYFLDTNYPLDGTISLSLFPKRVNHFTVSLRVPTWCSKFEVHIKDEIYQGQAGKYLELSRDWNPGDIIRICMNMNIQQNLWQDSLVFTRGPQVLTAPAELQGQASLPANWQGRQQYTITTIQNKLNEKIILVPFADACQLETIPSIYQSNTQWIEELPFESLNQLRSQLNTFRDEFGGANDMPNVKFFLFGMGNRPKFIYRDGILMDAMTKEAFKSWPISHQTIIPNDYRVELLSMEGDSISIYENESGVFIKEGNQSPTMIAGTELPLQLPQFKEYRYDQILKVLHHEILINIVNSQPLPNFLVYQKPWRRDAAMMAMCLEKTGNQNLIQEWVLNLDTPYDYNNKMDGIAEEETDNLGQTLYLLSLFSNKEHPLVSKVLEEIPKFQRNWLGKKYIKGRSDFGYHAVYQTKWLKFGLREIGLEDPYQLPNVNEGYNTLFWWDYKNPEQEAEHVEVWRYYPYISWAKDHYFGTKNSPISNRDYPLTWEIEASQADYEQMKLIDNSYYLGNNSSPHTWHAAEVFLYLYDYKK